MPPYRLRNLHQPRNQATVRHSEAKLKEVMSLSDLMEDKLRERVHDKTGGDDGVSSHHVAGQRSTLGMSDLPPSSREPEGESERRCSACLARTV